MTQSLDRTLELLVGLLRSDSVFIMMTPPYSVSFAFVDRLTLSSLLKSENVDRAEFEKNLSLIGDLLRGILTGTEAHVIKTLSEKHKEFPPEEIKRQADLVRKSIYSPRLQRRHDLKSNSKAQTFNAVDWDVKKKLADAQTDFVPFPYATVKIQYQREFGGDPYAFLGGRAFEWVQINFSSEEVKYLRRVLDKIQESIEEHDKGEDQ